MTVKEGEGSEKKGGREGERAGEGGGGEWEE